MNGNGTPEQRRIVIGILGVVAGLLVTAVGVAIAHFTNLPTHHPITNQPILPAVPRGWQFVTLGQIVAFVGSQIAVFAFLYGWILDQPLSWARAGVASLIAWLELVFLLGVIPSEWLNLTQGPLEWTAQKRLLTIPRWLVLNNDVGISLAAVKDAVSGGWFLLVTAGLIVFTYRLQERGKRPPAPARPPTSPYGRPLVKGD